MTVYCAFERPNGPNGLLAQKIKQKTAKANIIFSAQAQKTLRVYS